MQVKEGRVFIGRLDHEGDLLDSLTSVCKENNIKLGVFSVIGAVRGAKLGFYDQEQKKYEERINIKKKLEITSCNGNISLIDSDIFVHSHITLVDREGNCYGGHLMPGSRIFAAEYYIKELTGAVLARKNDPETGLSLWEK
ncbi:MAG: PPC domain-containing DNA-binding protein [bacterium]